MKSFAIGTDGSVRKGQQVFISQEDLDRINATTKRAEELEALVIDLEARCERFAQAFLNVLPDHYEHVLFFHYTIDRPAVYRKFMEWAKSPKNTVRPYDPEYLFKKLGLEEGDLVKRAVEEGQ